MKKEGEFTSYTGENRLFLLLARDGQCVWNVYENEYGRAMEVVQ
jgi:hypothetical protein